MALLGAGSGVSSPTTNYMELMKSRTVLEPIIDAMDWDDPEKKPDAKAFAKSYLDIMKEKAENEAGLAAAQASEEALEKRRAEVEDHLSDFPQEVIEYLQLQRDTNIKNEIYVNLVKQCEQNKIQEAMDVQVIDPANLPDEDKPSSPRKKLITAIGLVLGCIIAFDYSLVMYKREA